jgi:hypothetical protein
MAVQFASQVGLLIPGVGPARMLFRMVSFGMSLALLRQFGRRDGAHPSGAMLACVVAILGISLFHPTTNTYLAGVAQVALNLAILAPVFWVPFTGLDAAGLRKTLLLTWAFHAVGSAMGVLQTYYPGSFQPPISSVIAGNQTEGYMESLMIQTASGAMVYRPMGLTDIPGGAANSGYYAVMLGAGFLLLEKRFPWKLIFAGSMALGVIALLLSQVRAQLVMLVCCLIVLLVIFLRRKEVAKFTSLAVTIAALGAVGFAGAVALGGASVTDRINTLLADDPGDVYKQNRGEYLDYTIQEQLPMYPLGAGLGRWGMMNAYFGDNSNPETADLWVEIQWTGWLLDGGVPLILAYTLALVAAFWAMWKIASKKVKRSNLWLWASILLAYNVGAFALTFSYPVFVGTSGLEFWLLNAAVFAAARSEQTPRYGERLAL